MIEVHLGFRCGSFWPVMKRIIMAIVGVVLGSGLFWGVFFYYKVTSNPYVWPWSSLKINPRDTYYDLGLFEIGPWFMFTTFGGLIGLLVGLQVYARLFKNKPK